MDQYEAERLRTAIEWNGKVWVCKHCGRTPELFYVATGHDHTDYEIDWCMCRETAIKQVEIQTLRENLLAAQAEIDDIKQVQFPRKVKAVAEGWRNKLAACQAENQKLREAMERCLPLADYGRVGTKDVEQAEFQQALKSAIATTSDTTALTEYRNGVIEECAVLLDKMDSQYFDGYEFRHVLPEDCAEDLRAMKEKP